MWTRAELKAVGKENFKRFYWVSIAVCVFTYFCSGTFPGSDSGINFNINSSYNETYYDEFDYFIEEPIETESDSFILSFGNFDLPDFMDSAIYAFASAGVIMTVITVAILSFAFYYLVINPIIIGKNHYFMGIRQSERRFTDVFILFKERTFFKAGITSFFMNLYILLWSLLLIIPGIIKSYEYLMIPYILAENPTINRNRAFELSKAMMSGQKWDAFVLHLSFIGWDLLSGLTFGLLGIFYVNPYREATLAELYATLRKEAIDHHIATTHELPGFN